MPSGLGQRAIKQRTLDLDVAGPRESQVSGICHSAASFLECLLERLEG
ncbi:MAG: hypothetical protein HC897_11040 [Thermoanaerobaculia bacterium]|nr:hypothetical protein [Thermoanaerobaculia bacterium]